MKTPLDRPHYLRRCIALLGLVLAAMTAFACSGRDELVTFGGGTTNDGGAPPSFVEPDAGDGEGGASAPIPEPLMCLTTECPAPFASCSHFGALRPYACSTDLSSDPDNCGACGNRCAAGSSAYHFKRSCSNGVCQPICDMGYADCNGTVDDGCESDLQKDPNNCGFCGNQCTDGVACIDGQCGCPPGTMDCDGTCVDITSDDANCGACGYKCVDHQPDDAGTPPPNMFYGCHQSQCKALRCYYDDDVFWADCNGAIESDGCEVDLAQPNADHCGKCGNQCTASQQCFSTSDTGMDCQCKDGQHLCPAAGWMPPQCANLDTDTRNCGSCGYTCPTIDNADPVCNQGRCDFTCKPGYADCNGRADDGCEVDLRNDPRNCGSCGAACDVANGQPCAGGTCATKPCDDGEPQ